MIAVALVAQLFVTSCKEDVDPTPTAADLLTEGVWKISSVVHDEEGDLTSHYTGMTMQFNADGTYGVEGGGLIFAEPGTWTLQENGSSNVLDLSNGLSIDAQIGESSLVLKFAAQAAGGRIKSLGGDYTFSFTK